MPDDRPVLLVVENESYAVKPPAFRVVTCPVESVALEFVAESRPKAVLLDVKTLHLEGAACLDRWNAASPGTRVLFLDADGPWCLLIELHDGDSGEQTINPCGSAELSRAVEELLSRDPGRTEVSDDRLAVLVA